MTLDKLVLEAFMASVKKAISRAGSAREEIVTSRDEPMPPKAVPISIPAKDRKKRVRARNPTSTMTSARAAVGICTENIGTIEVATTVTLKTR